MPAKKETVKKAVAEEKKAVKKAAVKAAAKPAAKKAAVKAAVKTAPAKKAAVKAAAAKKTAVKKAEVIIESPMGGTITPDQILKKVGSVEKVYVRVDQNKAYWVRGEESGDVDLW